MGVNGKHGEVVSKAGSPETRPNAHIAIIGAGPAGLFAAERLSETGHRVTVYDRMASPARKFLMAGRGGLNLTHSEPLESFLSRYSASAAPLVAAAVRAFPPAALIEWANGLGAETFTGSSGRIFPKAMKASPLLRAWLARLRDRGVAIEMRRRWRGFDAKGALLLADAAGVIEPVAADGALLALGGASWPKLGSDGHWASILAADGVAIAPFEPSNCGVRVCWSEPMRRCAGTPLKRISIACGTQSVKGEAVITTTGLEGGAIYALTPKIRAALDSPRPHIRLDLKPDMSVEHLAQRLAAMGSKPSTATLLRKAAGLSAAAAILVREAGPLPRESGVLAARIKGVELAVTGLSGLERAISTAGGIKSRALTSDLMLLSRPGVFVAGEMLDFDAPTGGYLLQASFATATRASAGILDWVKHRADRPAPC